MEPFYLLSRVNQLLHVISCRLARKVWSGTELVCNRRIEGILRRDIIVLEGKIDEVSWVNWAQGSGNEEGKGHEIKRDQNDQVGGGMEWETNERELT